VYRTVHQGGARGRTRGRTLARLQRPTVAYGEGPVSGPCDLVGAPVLGIGTGKFTFPFHFTPGGAIVAHVTVQGMVELVSGGQARVFGTARVLILPDGTFKFDEERVRLKPM
jgi:hypothetical protein